MDERFGCLVLSTDYVIDGERALRRIHPQVRVWECEGSRDQKHNSLTFSWIGSSLRISPPEQVTFLTKVVNRGVAVSHYAYAMTE